MRGFSARRKPSCTSCAQATLYGARIEQAAALLGREKAHAHVEAVVRPGNDGIISALPEDADYDAITTGIKTNSSERTKAEKEAVDERVNVISSKADQLRQQIECYKAVAAKQKDSNIRRRKELAIERTQLDKHRNRAVEPVQSAIRKAQHRLDKVHKRTFEAREHLCKEVSSLSCLNKLRKQDGKTQFFISFLPLPDLRDLNGINERIATEIIETSQGPKRLAEPHELFSASLDSVCRMLGICCHYLSIRLPAEIILPHNDFPHAAILPRDSSYKVSHVQYPGFGSQSSSPEASRILPRGDLSRPRILQLDKPLPQLQKDDPKMAMFLIEGVSLLAYDIAWLCRSQGIDTINTFEDICGISRNLHQLLPGKDYKTQSRPVLNRNPSTAPGKAEQSIIATVDSKPRFGTHSHGSARHSLAGHEGFDLFGHEVWQISVTRLTDQLRSYLSNETARAEWHIVEDTEWDEEMEEDRPVLVGGAKRPEPAMSVLSVKPSDGTDEADMFTDRTKGNNGWMKVRGRGGES